MYTMDFNQLAHVSYGGIWDLEHDAFGKYIAASGDYVGQLDLVNDTFNVFHQEPETIYGVTGDGVDFQPIPEPMTLGLLAMGLAGLGIVGRKKRR